MTEDTLLSTKQALPLVQRRFPGLHTAPQLMRQVHIGALPVARVHGRKMYFRLADLTSFEPRYEVAGRNPRPPTWNGDDFTIREAAAILGCTRAHLTHLVHLKRVSATKENGTYRIPRSEVVRLREERA